MPSEWVTFWISFHLPSSCADMNSPVCMCFNGLYPKAGGSAARSPPSPHNAHQRSAPTLSLPQGNRELGRGRAGGGNKGAVSRSEQASSSLCKAPR